MPVIKATKTLKAIDAAIKADQGLEYRRQLKIAMDAADDPFRSEPEDDFRSHLGGSTIGRDCPRQLWYMFHWVKLVKHTGRLLRLFNRGHLEEPRFVAMLRQAGMTVWQTDANNKQFRVSGHGGHFGSAIDGVVGGCPDVAKGVNILTEMKTHNLKNFTKLVKEGVRQSKYEHFVQMQIYMRAYGLKFALYLAVCKDDDELYGEIVPYEQEIADQYWERAGFIVFSEQPPARINPSSAYYICKFCDFREICHKAYQPERNCRTCRFSLAMGDGTWRCRYYDGMPVLDKPRQLVGCGKWELNEGISSASSS